MKCDTQSADISVIIVADGSRVACPLRCRFFKLQYREHEIRETDAWGLDKRQAISALRGPLESSPLGLPIVRCSVHPRSGSLRPSRAL